MTLLCLETVIHAPIERCFDLARSIDVHQVSTAATRERAVAGRTTGLIEKGETVTWQATHLFVRQRLSVVITDMNRPYSFRDEMIQGAFASMQHEHLFSEEQGATLMQDRFRYDVPCGGIGRLFDRLVLRAYMTNFLTERNNVLKECAETDMWKRYLP